MKKHFLLVAVLMLVNLACLLPAAPAESWTGGDPSAGGGIWTPSPQPSRFDAAACEAAVVELINAERARAGLSVLVRDETLMTIARQRSEDMVRRGYYGHHDPETGDPVVFKLLAAHGYGGVAGENVDRQMGPGTAAAAARISVRAWLNSAAHRQNIMDPAYRRTGVGSALDSSGRVYLTQVFTD